MPAAGSTTLDFKATFKENYPKVGAPIECNGSGAVSPGCFGGGQIVGYGKAIESFTFLGLLDDPLPTGCIGRPYGTSTIELVDGRGTLETYEEYLDCIPGASQDAPGHLISYGNPILTEGTYTITGGTGVFEGASGSGAIDISFAGSALMVSYDGVIVLP
jgi:hypothetical protein